MKVKCELCDIKNDIDDQSLLAKRLRNHPIRVYICEACFNRIKQKAEKRNQLK